MYEVRVLSGSGYRIEYPEFSGEGTSVANKCYGDIARSLEGYFRGILEKDGRSICRCRFAVEDCGDTFDVRLTLTLRRSGNRYARQELCQRWRRWQGRDAVMERVG